MGESTPPFFRLPRTTCRWCAKPLPTSDGPGRPREYCNRSHRQRFHEWVRRGGSDLNFAQIAERDNYTCGICSGPVDMTLSGTLGPSIDHIVPVSRGGSNDAANLQLAHVICNTRKRDQISYRCAPPTTAVATEPPLTLFPWSW